MKMSIKPKTIALTLMPKICKPISSFNSNAFLLNSLTLYGENFPPYKVKKIKRNGPILKEEIDLQWKSVGAIETDGRSKVSS